MIQRAIPIRNDINLRGKIKHLQMDKSSILKNISALTSKIQKLNEGLKEGDQIHPVELDLMNAYLNELNQAVEQLGTATNQNHPATASKPQIESVKEEVEEPKHAAPPVFRPVNENPLAQTETTENEASAVTKEPIIKPLSAEPVHETDNTLASEDFPPKSPPRKEISSPVDVPVKDPVQAEKDVEELAGRINKEMHLPEKSGEFIPPDPEERKLKVETSEPESIEENSPKSINDRLGGENQDLSQKLARQPAKSILAELDLAQKFQLSRELFEADTDLFERAMRKLNDCSTFENARQLLHGEIKNRFDWEGKEKYVSRIEVLLERKFGVED